MGYLPFNRLMTKKLTSYYLIIALLTSMLYVPVYTHTCNLFKKSTTSVFRSNNCVCDAAETREASFDVNCCSLKIQTFTTDHQGVTPNITFSKHDISLPFSGVIPSFNEIYQPNRLISEISVRPPPQVKIQNNSFIILNQVFRI